jgi:hypothetical protein
MSKSAHLSSPPPTSPRSEPALYNDRSAVRPRIQAASHAAASTGPGDDPEPDSSEQWDSDRPTLPSGSNDWAEEENEQLDRKLRFAKIVLQLLPAGDARARLLRMAILQRDEPLLEGLLNSLDDTSPGDTAPSEGKNPDSASPPDERRTLLPPARRSKT